MRNKHFLALSLVLALSFSGGCAARVQTVTNTPAGVTSAQVQSWDKAVAQLHTIATVTSTLRQTMIALHTSGVIKDGQAYVSILNAIGSIDQAQIAASRVLQTVPNNWSASTKTQVTGFINVISQQLASLTNAGVIGISDPTKQQQVSQLIGELAAAANIIINLV